MGLDMYLFKYPRVEGFTREDIALLANIHTDIMRHRRDAPPDLYMFDESCIDQAEQLIASAEISYASWDWREEFPRSSLETEVAYWRKANAIHAYFVDAVQDGEDDCDFHHEVTPDVLRDLKDRCRKIIESTVMVNSKIKNGMRYDFDTGTWKDIMEEGKVVINPDVCRRLLPTESGCFFGSTDYDEWYIEDITYTYDTCDRLLRETDFDHEMLFYVSSW